MEPTEVDFDQRLQFAKIRAMVMILSKKLGDANPYAEFSDLLPLLSVEQRTELVSSLHELLYTPPDRK